jgi:hypothetical protein
MASFASSYIKTEASQVTRSSDAASMTGANFSSWYRQDEGTVYAEFLASPATTTFPNVLRISDGSFNNMLYIDSTNEKIARLVVDNSGVNQTVLNFGTLTTNVSYKFAGSFKFNDVAASLNSGNVLTDTSANIPLVNMITIGNSTLGTQAINNCIKRIAYYPAKLSSTQLQALTS